MPGIGRWKLSIIAVPLLVTFAVTANTGPETADRIIAVALALIPLVALIEWALIAIDTHRARLDIQNRLQQLVTQLRTPSTLESWLLPLADHVLIGDKRAMKPTYFPWPSRWATRTIADAISVELPVANLYVIEWRIDQLIDVFRAYNFGHLDKHYAGPISDALFDIRTTVYSNARQWLLENGTREAKTRAKDLQEEPFRNIDPDVPIGG